MPITISGSGNISGLGTGVITQANMANNSVGSPQIINSSTIVTPNIATILSGTSGVLPVLKDSTGNTLNSLTSGYAGYYTLPSGFIIQWQTLSFVSTPVTWTFPIAFPNTCAGVTGLLYWGGSQAYLTLQQEPVGRKANVSIASTSTGINAYVIAIGW